MATLEEKQELIDVIKRPTRYYKLMLWGYGGENSYMPLTEEQYKYWTKRNEDADDDVLLDYMLDEDRAEINDVPPEMDFMADPDDYESARYAWYDSPNQLEHQYGVDYYSARITITEVESDDYNAKPIEDVVESEELKEWVDALQAEDDYETEMVNMDVGAWDDPSSQSWKSAEYILQFNSSEKGTFFEGRFTTTGPINLKKLKFHTIEYANGDDTVEDITYDGESIENDGAETNGKGYSVHMWKNNNI